MPLRIPRGRLGSHRGEAVPGSQHGPEEERLRPVLRGGSRGSQDQGVKPARPRTQPPWVIDRLQTKRDYEVYLDRRWTHLYVFDVPAKKLTQITSGDFDDDQPAWSPDGRFVVFVSNRDKEPDATFNTDLWLVAPDNPDRGRTMVRLTHNPGEDAGPAWSPDGRWITFVTWDDTGRGHVWKSAVSGGAPLGERLGHFFRGVGLTVLEGYGLTETAGAVTAGRRRNCGRSLRAWPTGG